MELLRWRALAVLLALAPAMPARPALPVINSFSSSRGAVGSAGVWRTDFLQWSVSGATSVSIDNGVGVVTGTTSATVSPSGMTRYTLTASNAAGSVTASWTEGYIPLVQISPTLYKTEHSVYYIPDPAQVSFPDYNSVLSVSNMNTVYLPQLQSAAPGDYMMVVVAANHLTPNSVPNVITQRHLADGIGDAINGVGVPNLCRYNIGGFNVIDGSLGVFDHEIGHNWAARLGLEVANGHWYANSTVHGQMADNFPAVNNVVQQINGNPVDGFTWTGVDNTVRNNTDVFSDQDLYLMGLHPVFPDTYVLTNPVFNADHTVSSSTVSTYGQAWMLGKNGARNPSYRTSDKQFKLGFIFVAQTLTEVQDSYFSWERSIAHFENAEAIDSVRFPSQVPFLVETKYRASVHALLGDLDGNATPTITLGGPAYAVSSDGTAALTYTALDADGPAPTVSLVPAAPEATLGAGMVVLQGLSVGTHFFTLKAEDAFGKKAFTHFVVDVTGASPQITWPALSAITYGTALSASQLNAAALVPGTFTYVPGPGSVLNAGTAQTLLVQFTPTDTSAFSTAARAVTIDVSKATPALTWAAPSAISVGTALSSVQLNAATPVSGTLTYSPPAGTVLGAGAHQLLSVSFVPLDALNYNAANATTFVDVVVGPAFTDDPLVAGSTSIKAVHLTELRTAVATLRARYGLPVFVWTDTTLTAGSTSPRAVHITELRSALLEAYTAAGMGAPNFTALAAGGAAISAQAISEIRSAIRAIW